MPVWRTIISVCTKIAISVNVVSWSLYGYNYTNYINSKLLFSREWLRNYCLGNAKTCFYLRDIHFSDLILTVNAKTLHFQTTSSSFKILSNNSTYYWLMIMVIFKSTNGRLDIGIIYFKFVFLATFHWIRNHVRV